MLEMIFVVGFAGFIAVAILGHVMLFKAIMNPDRPADRRAQSESASSRPAVGASHG